MVDFIRDTNVDLRNYLPPYLFNDPEFTAKLAAESAEHDNMRKTLIDICNQLFVSTATWGLNRWEKFLDIPTDYTQTYESRRQKILRKLQGGQTVTLEFLTKLVNLYVANGQAVVIDHPETYSTDFNIPLLDKENMDKMTRDVRTYIPAHIGQVYKTHADTNAGNHVAMLKSTAKTIDVYPAAVEKITPESAFYAAIAMTTTERLTLYIGGI